MDGGEQLRRLARDLDGASAKLRRELPTRMRRAGERLVPPIRASAAERLPKRGGLNRYVAESAIRVVVSTAPSTTKVAVVGRLPKRGGRVDLEALNAGQVRHPVFTTGVWVEEKIRPGFWDDAVAKHEDQVRAEVVGVMDEIRRKLEAG